MELGEEGLFFGFKSVEFLSELAVQISFVLQIVLQISVDHVLERGHFVKFALQLLSKRLLLPQALGNVRFLVRCLFELGEDHIQTLHQADFLGLQLLELVTQGSLSIGDFALHAEVVLRRPLAWL